MQHYNLKGLGVQLRGVKACSQLFAPIFDSREHELFLVALLNAKCELIQLLTITGERDQVQICIADIFKEALSVKAEAIIVAHNHPSGCDQPSRSDKVLTRSIVLASEALDLCLIDHLIFGGCDVYSFRQHGLL